jgi:hypothetical protein
MLERDFEAWLETPPMRVLFTMSDDEESDSDIDEEDTRKRENGEALNKERTMRTISS